MRVPGRNPQQLEHPALPPNEISGAVRRAVVQRDDSIDLGRDIFEEAGQITHFVVEREQSKDLDSGRRSPVIRKDLLVDPGRATSQSAPCLSRHWDAAHARLEGPKSDRTAPKASGIRVSTGGAAAGNPGSSWRLMPAQAGSAATQNPQMKIPRYRAESSSGRMMRTVAGMSKGPTP